MNKKGLLFILFAVITALTACQPKAEDSPLSATLSEITGLVQIRQAEADAFESVSASATLNVNGQIQTGDDGRVRLDLSSGTIIRVAPSSLFTLTSNDEGDGGLLTKIKMEVGKIFIILNGGRADVETPSGVASVRGSYMKVEVDPNTNDVYVTCLEGNCSVRNPNGEEVNFTNGQRAVLFHQDPNTGEWNSPLLGDMTPDEFQEWLDNNPEAQALFDQAMAALTATSATEAPTEVPPTEIDAAAPEGGSSNACSQIQEPANGSSLGKAGQVNFAWSEHPDAQAYVITFVNADGSTARIETSTNSAEFYIEVLPNGGSYEWFVTVYGADGKEICSSPSAQFSKPKADPTEKAKPEKEEEQEPPADPSNTTCDPCDPFGSCYSYSCFGY